MSSDPRVQSKPRLPKSYTPEQLAFLRSHLPEFQRRSQGSIRGDAKKFALLRASDFIIRFGLPEDFGGVDRENRFRVQIYNWYKNTVGRTRRKLEGREGRPRIPRKISAAATAVACADHQEISVESPPWPTAQPTYPSETVTVTVPEADPESPDSDQDYIAPLATPPSIAASITPLPSLSLQPTQVHLPPPTPPPPPPASPSPPQQPHPQLQPQPQPQPHLNAHHHRQYQADHVPQTQQDQHRVPQPHQSPIQSKPQVHKPQPQRLRLKQQSSNDHRTIEAPLNPPTLREAFLALSFDVAALSSMIQSSVASASSSITPLNPIIDSLFEAVSSAEAASTSSVHMLVRRFLQAAEYFPRSLSHAGVNGPNAGARALQMRIRKHSVWIPAPPPAAAPPSASQVLPQNGTSASFVRAASQAPSNSVASQYRGASYGSSAAASNGHVHSAPSTTPFHSQPSYNSSSNPPYGDNYAMNNFTQSSGSSSSNLAQATHQGYQPPHHHSHNNTHYTSSNHNAHRMPSTPPMPAQSLMSPPHTIHSHLSTPMQSHSSSLTHATPLLPHTSVGRSVRAHHMPSTSGMQVLHGHPTQAQSQLQSQPQLQSHGQAHQVSQHQGSGTSSADRAYQSVGAASAGAIVSAPAPVLASTASASLTSQMQRIAADRQRRKDHILWAMIHAAALELGAMGSVASHNAPDTGSSPMAMDHDDMAGNESAYGDATYHTGSPHRYADGSAMYPPSHHAHAQPHTHEHHSYPTPSSVSPYPTPSSSVVYPTVGSPSSPPPSTSYATATASTYAAACAYASARAFSEGFVADSVWAEDEAEWAAGACVLRALIAIAGRHQLPHSPASSSLKSSDAQRSSGGRGTLGSGPGERLLALEARARERREYEELLRTYEGRWKEIRDEARQTLMLEMLLQAREAMGPLEAELQADADAQRGVDGDASHV
ncbi:hypothetical protein HGRIS_011354 [Hohenbuehelia grisea]|uniref:Uncharacterized protein n=1 Tax=Hohenbuehelia grisea TaxID=104357 RepID=A0ABR3JUV7_9AGAR